MPICPTVTPNAMKKLLAKSWCARQIMLPNRQIGILIETGITSFHLVTPAIVDLCRKDKGAQR
jgi:hypothetical protein